MSLLAYAGSSTDQKAVTESTHAVSLSANAAGSLGASGTSSGSISGVFLSGGSTTSPALHASASGISGGDSRDPNGEAGGGTAICSWTDDLRLDNPLIADSPIFLQTYAIFMCHIDGTVSGPGAYATVTVQMERATANEDTLRYGGSTYFLEPISLHEDLVLKVPIEMFFYDVQGGYAHYPEFTFGLLVHGGSAYGPSDNWLGDGKADFGNTLALDTVYFGDADGNPVSGLEDVHILGDAGAYVMGPPVPEPGAWGLLGAGLLSLGSARPMRRRRGLGPCASMKILA